jgi:hypothetical protein
MRAAIYARVSTFDQEPENQLAEIRRYIDARGWTAVDYVDRGISGAKDRRPALDQLLTDARRRRFDVLVVWRLDRLGRNLRHPTLECIERLHIAGVKTYWTETGAGVAPEPGLDVVGGTIVVEVQAASTSTYTVRPTAAGTAVDTYQTWLAAGAPTVTYAWSKRSNLYHVATCRFVASISPDNLQTGTTPPAGKTLHKDCPQ